MEPRRFVMDPGPSDPSVLTKQDKHISKQIWEEGLLLGVSPPPNKLDGSRLNMKWLQDTFGVLHDDANEVTVQQYTRAYILELLGGSYFADKSREKVHLMFLPMLEDFDAAGRYSWGSAVLAWLYRELCRATDPDSCDIAGALILVQLWAWSRFPHISPAIKSIQPIADADVDVDAAQPLPGGPYGNRWRNAKDVKDVSTHVLEQYRSDFARQRPDQVIWQPYTDDVLSSLPEYCRIGQEVWRSVTPLICFQIVEWHLPNRALRQFGMQQDIPQPVNTDEKLHDCDLRGKVHENWRQRWRNYITIWDHRREHVVTRDQMVGLMAYHDPYMDWYRRITRRFISRRSGCYEMMTPVLIQLFLQPLLGGECPRAQRPPRPRAQRPSRPSDPSSSMSVPPTQLRDATTVTKTTPMSSAHTTTPISVAHTTTPISVAQTTTPISAAHHEHTVSFLTQTFSPLASFSGVTPSSPTQSVGPTLVTQSVVPTSVTQSGGPASSTQLGGPAPSLPHPSGPSSATQLEDLVRDIEVGDHGMGRGRGRGTKRPQPDMPVVLKRNPPRNKRKPCCGTE
uniref:Aminotransferase-like plant mobile domain-containing protein n=1 Tax=Fagus sylvatica TaxID=28930 RepID=A0A2N9GV37_FAGSY